MHTGPTHSELLTRANKLRAAAEDHDVERLRREVTNLLEAFVAHAGTENSKLAHLSSFTARLVARGQQRILDRLVDLSLEADLEDACHCDRIGEELAALLTLQAEAERRAFSGISQPPSIAPLAG